MRRTFIYLLFFGLAGYVWSGCDAFSSSDGGGTVTLTGQVVDSDQNVVANAFVRVLPMDVLVETNVDGTYVLDIDIDSTMSLIVIATKNGFTENSVQVLAIADREIEVPTIQITANSSTPEVSGSASNIIFSSQSSASIGVTESGSVEIAKIVFMATDSTGQPVSIGKAIDINFSISEGPGGGEFIFPTTVRTNNNGEATVNVSAGRAAGVIQLLAEANVNGRLIRSLPVAITIHGGLPDDAHFTIGPTLFNFPGLVRFGITDGISILVGDKFGNPVRTGTAVYFTTNYGVIQGSTLTGESGSGSVNLISGNPLPPDGVTIVTATTADENENPIVGTTPVLMTGSPIITLVQTASSNAPFFRSYDFTVTDRNLNPLSAGTSITTAAGGTKVKVVGDSELQIGDTVFLGGGMTYNDVLRGPGITEFSFGVVEDESGDENLSPSLQSVTVAVASPNGNLQLTFGASGVLTTTEGATVELVDGKTIVRAREDF